MNLSLNLFAFITPGPVEMVCLAIVAVLLFGRRIPDAARSVGRSIVEFKRGIREIEDEDN